MTTYPLTFPDVPVTSSSFRLVNLVADNTSPFTGEQQVYAYPGQYWEGEITLSNLSREHASLVQAFMAKCRGKFGTFLFHDTHADALGVRGSGETGAVNGSGQSGNTLNLDGFTPNTLIASACDYFQLGNALTVELKMLTENVLSDANGEAVAVFEPNVRRIPNDNEAISFSSPKGLFRLSENIVEWSSGEPNFYDINIAFREAV